MIKRITMLITDIAVTACILLGIWVYYYRTPHKGIHAIPLSSDVIYQNKYLEGVSNDNNYQTTNVIAASEDWHKKFANHFSDTIIVTDHSYKSPSLSIELSYGNIETNQLNMSESGKHKKYGSKIAYTLADVYISDITCFQTAFADDTYGKVYSEKLTGMSARIKSILAINGDSYSNNLHKDNGTIIQNGVIYRSKSTDMETCILNWDGTMQIYTPQELDTQKLIDTGAYQSWVFGPSLLDQKGKAKTDFLTWDYIIAFW